MGEPPGIAVEEQQLVHFGSTVDACYGVTADQRIVFWNHAAEKLLGRPAAAAVGRYCFETIGWRRQSGEPICQRDCFPIRQARAGAVIPILRGIAQSPGVKPGAMDVATVVVPNGDPDGPCLVHYVRPAFAPADAAPLVLAAAPTPARSRRSALTPAERRVLALLAAGASTPAIAAALGIAHLTARNHIQHVIDKLGAHSRVEAIALARCWSLTADS